MTTAKKPQASAMTASRETAGFAYNGYTVLVVLLGLPVMVAVYFIAGMGPALGPVIGVPFVILASLLFFLWRPAFS